MQYTSEVCGTFINTHYRVTMKAETSFCWFQFCSDVGQQLQADHYGQSGHQFDCLKVTCFYLGSPSGYDCQQNNASDNHGHPVAPRPTKKALLTQAYGGQRKLLS